MTASAHPAIGETRICPHCKSKILKSAAVCPACHHFLRFEAVRIAHKPIPSFQPLRIEGTIRQPLSEKACEYSLVVEIRNEGGEEIVRQVVAVGSLGPSEARTFALWVEVYLPENARAEQSLA
ncbi:MAG: hypothetical protein HYY45_00795 [Deltaproteobacteria bacterium]|nr:hypothetical protein [Deltaproteobacteria bacterium]